jgi:penicillin amidase
LATCNNQIISQDGGAQKIPGFYDPYRIIRADEVLSGEQLFSPEDLRKLQMDLISSQALRWKEVLARAADRSGDKESAEKLRNWNGEMSGESRVAGLFQIWWELLPGNFLGDEVKDRGVQAGNKIKEALLTLKNASWVDDVDTKKIETWNDIMEKTFLQAKERWQGKKWSDFITLSFKHMLSKSKIFSFFFRWDAGEFSYHGSGGTLNASFYRYEADGNRFNVVVAPSMRMIVDFSALDSSTFYLPVGQSGHPYSGHYRDMVNIWLNDSTNYLPISWEGGLDKRVSQLNLLPGF